MGGPAIAVGERFPVIERPFRSLDLSLPDGLVVFAFDKDWNGQPMETFWSFDLISVAPITSGILHVIVEDEFIH